MAKKESKRYLVTYQDGSISTANAESILSIENYSIKDGVELLRTDAEPKNNEILHFENLGISSIDITEEKAKELRKNSEILSVEEDVEMYALGMLVDDDTTDVLEEDATQENYAYDKGTSIETLLAETYKQGYNQAFLEIYAALLKNNRNNNEFKIENLKDKLVINPIFPDFNNIIRPPIDFSRFKQPISWNISMVKAPQAWNMGYTGAGINVAILDTGIASHPDLAISGGVSFIQGVVSHNDGHGHGTHCAGVVGAKNNMIGVVGVAPSANLFAVKVLSDAGSGPTSGIIAGIEWCIQNNIKVASMSLGGENSPFVAYATAIERAQLNGVCIVCAAGNSYNKAFKWVNSPANSILLNRPNASPIAVGAVDQNLNIASFSSRGGNTSLWNQVSCVAPGVGVNSTYLNNGYTLMNGTSMATPHVAGLAALICQRFPGISPLNIKRRIELTCQDLGLPGLDITYGKGLINCIEAVR